ncbi:phasin family protein [Methyloceanibacter sp. wino2]|uniref:phasin family protein n=1 Tax=Methyloceanibacter sp. wino2 TaxID=2170729 RepID=UPI000D3EA508|nr:phasin family protein [Methyloceanibacter sp. wino2]
MTKDTTITAHDGKSRTKPRAVKPVASKPAVSKRKSNKSTGGVPAKAVATASSKAAVKKAAKAVAKVSDKTKASAAKPASKPLKAKSLKAKPVNKAKPVTRTKATVPAPLLGRSLQSAVPAALAVNTKLVDIAHSNVSAGLELARDLAGAKTPMEAMRLGVAYWFNHMGAVQTQARELQSLSAAWVKTASEQIRPL